MQNRIERGQAMRKVTVNRKDLLVKLEANRIKHTADYNDAVEEYRKTALLDIQAKKDVISKQLDELASKVKDSKEPEDLSIKENLYFDVKPPVSHERDYAEIIEMFKWSVDDNIELDSAEFSQYVLDNWTWAKDIENSRIFYATKQIGFAK